MSNDEEKLSRLYHEGSNEMPSSQLDDVILNAAREAAHQPVADKNIKAKSPFSGSWPTTVSIAAVLVITVILIPLIEQDTPQSTSTESADENELFTGEQKQEQDSLSRLSADTDREQSSMKAKKRSLMEIQEVHSYQSAPVTSTQGKLAKEISTVKTMAKSTMPTSSEASVSTPMPASRSMASPSLHFNRIDNENEQLNLEDNLAAELDSSNSRSKPLPAKQWLEKIKKLIAQENYAQAKIELDAFKRHYPNEEIEPSITESINSKNLAQ